MNTFICPKTKKTLQKDEDGNLWCMEGNQKYFYRNYAGSINFVGASLVGQELRHYNNVYKDSTKRICECLCLDRLKSLWHDAYVPWNRMLLAKLPNLEEKNVLLIGNGISVKELYFLSLGAHIIYTDLSLNAVLEMKHAFHKSHLYKGFKEKAEFHAVDALNLPFPDETVDIIYGYAFVHHIDDKQFDRFFSGVSRVLREGGICVFLDGAHSPVWHYIKKTICRPLQLYSHRKTGISPADLRSTERGGYREDEIKVIARKHNFESYFFERSSFFLRLWSRGVMKLFGNEELVKKGQPYFREIDVFFSRHSEVFRSNEMMLVWGFKK